MEAPDEFEEPGNIKFLRRLVTLLTIVMIGGLLTIVSLFVIRFSSPPAPSFPSEIRLPDGTTVTAFTKGDGWYAIVTATGEILIFDQISGEIAQRVQIKLGQ